MVGSPNCGTIDAMAAWKTPVRQHRPRLFPVAAAQSAQSAPPSAKSISLN
jgi:hypothetical protein